MNPAPKKKVVALYGYYKYGNFGDDLMAVIVGKEFQSHHVSFRVYGLPSEIAQEFNFHHTVSLEDLLEGADVLVYGGGGVFLPRNPLNPRQSEFDEELARLCALCDERKIPILMISVGGEGRSADELSPARRQILKQAKYIGFRNSEDTVLAPQMSGEHRVYDDIVWAWSDTFHLKIKKLKRKILVIDKAVLGNFKVRMLLYTLIVLCRVLGRPYIFKFYDQHHKDSGSADPNSIAYINIPSFLEQIAASSLVLTSRLHLGMVAMSCRIPVVQLNPTHKAEIMFRRLGLDRLICKDTLSIFQLALRLLKKSGLADLTSVLQKVDIDGLRKNSARHFDEIFAQLSRV